MTKFFILIFTQTFLLSVYTDKSQATIYKLKPNDTLTVEFIFIGCSGGQQYKYDFCKVKDKYYGISYLPQQSVFRNPIWLVDTILSLDNKDIKNIADYEHNLLNYKPSVNTNAITGGGQFKIYLNTGFYKDKQINGFDSFKFGKNIQDIFTNRN